MAHHALFRAAARRVAMTDASNRRKARRVLQFDEELAFTRRRKPFISPRMYAGTIADTYRVRRSVQVAIRSEMHRMQVRNG